MDILGKRYTGQRRKTVSGRTCQRWDQQTPHSHRNNDPRKFPEETLAEAANYCRNPDNEPGGPWCYTTDRSRRWEYCGVLQCGMFKLISIIEFIYRG